MYALLKRRKKNAQNLGHPRHVIFVIISRHRQRAEKKNNNNQPGHKQYTYDHERAKKTVLFTVCCFFFRFFFVHRRRCRCCVVWLQHFPTVSLVVPAPVCLMMTMICTNNARTVEMKRMIQLLFSLRQNCYSFSFSHSTTQSAWIWIMNEPGRKHGIGTSASNWIRNWCKRKNARKENNTRTVEHWTEEKQICFFGCSFSVRLHGRKIQDQARWWTQKFIIIIIDSVCSGCAVRASTFAIAFVCACECSHCRTWTFSFLRVVRFFFLLSRLV